MTMTAVSMSNEQQQELLARTLKVNEIFFSIQGETTRTGLPTVFIRLTGCPLRCRYCDTEYAFYEGEKISIEGILRTVGAYRTRYVTVTGGEPLAQKNCLHLLSRLCDEGYLVSLETAGAMDISGVDPRVTKIMDLKTPGSGEESRNMYANIAYLGRHDELKFVICDRNDYEWAVNKMHELQLHECCTVLFSTSQAQLEDVKLAEWILEDRLPVRMQIQLHKYLWGNERGH